MYHLKVALIVGAGAATGGAAARRRDIGLIRLLVFNTAGESR
jgi:hypothetical protein